MQSLRKPGEYFTGLTASRRCVFCSRRGPVNDLPPGATKCVFGTSNRFLSGCTGQHTGVHASPHFLAEGSAAGVVGCHGRGVDGVAAAVHRIRAIDFPVGIDIECRR